MIIKVQVERGECARITSSDGKLQIHVHLSGPLVARLNGKRMRYFHAAVAHGSLEIGDEAKGQAW